MLKHSEDEWREKGWMVTLCHGIKVRAEDGWLTFSVSVDFRTYRTNLFRWLPKDWHLCDNNCLKPSFVTAAPCICYALVPCSVLCLAFAHYLVVQKVKASYIWQNHWYTANCKESTVQDVTRDRLRKGDETIRRTTESGNVKLFNCCIIMIIDEPWLCRNQRDLSAKSSHFKFPKWDIVS